MGGFEGWGQIALQRVERGGFFAGFYEEFGAVRIFWIGYRLGEGGD